MQSWSSPHSLIVMYQEISSAYSTAMLSTHSIAMSLLRNNLSQCRILIEAKTDIILPLLFMWQKGGKSTVMDSRSPPHP